jgi:hypothetical protein
VVARIQGGLTNDDPLGQPTLLDPTYIEHQKYTTPKHTSVPNFVYSGVTYFGDLAMVF